MSYFNEGHHMGRALWGETAIHTLKNCQLFLTCFKVITVRSCSWKWRVLDERVLVDESGRLFKRKSVEYRKGNGAVPSGTWSREIVTLLYQKRTKSFGILSASWMTFLCHSNRETIWKPGTFKLWRFVTSPSGFCSFSCCTFSSFQL